MLRSSVFALALICSAQAMALTCLDLQKFAVVDFKKVTILKNDGNTIEGKFTTHDDSDIRALGDTLEPFFTFTHEDETSTGPTQRSRDVLGTNTNYNYGGTRYDIFFTIGQLKRITKFTDNCINGYLSEAYCVLKDAENKLNTSMFPMFTLSTEFFYSYSSQPTRLKTLKELQKGLTGKSVSGPIVDEMVNFVDYTTHNYLRPGFKKENIPRMQQIRRDILRLGLRPSC